MVTFKHELTIKIVMSHDDANQQFIGRVLYDTFAYNQKAAFKPFYFARATGLTLPEFIDGDVIEAMTEQITGLHCTFRVGQEKRGEGMKAAIKAYLPRAK